MLDISFEPDQSTLDDLFSALDKAYIHTKRSAAEFCNTTLYFILRNCVALTDRSNKSQIRSGLLASSRISPNAPLAAILAQKQLGKGHGLYGANMKAEMEKFIRVRAGRSTYIASRWIPAIRIIEPETKYKSGAARAKPVRRDGKFGGGGALAAKEGQDPKGYIMAAIDKLKGVDGASKILNEGLNRAIRQETESKLEYVAEKQWAENMGLLFK